MDIKIGLLVALVVALVEVGGAPQRRAVNLFGDFGNDADLSWEGLISGFNSKKFLDVDSSLDRFSDILERIKRYNFLRKLVGNLDFNKFLEKILEMCASIFEEVVTFQTEMMDKFETPNDDVFRTESSSNKIKDLMKPFIGGMFNTKREDLENLIELRRSSKIQDPRRLNVRWLTDTFHTEHQ